MQKVYVMLNELGLVKIGISKDPEQRAHQLANTSGFTVDLKWQSEPLGVAHSIEQSVHKHLSASRMRGEWFEGVSVEQAVATVKAIAGCEGVSSTGDIVQLRHEVHLKDKYRNKTNGKLIDDAIEEIRLQAAVNSYLWVSCLMMMQSGNQSNVSATSWMNAI
ncbi:GIY-YIG nuclease family protein [Photobacterium japonica]|uniref:GIY-YIG nuclease family protein n=1 Tax=Photobacterium japonica TaxID=2910235 RepID=UPI003D09C342